MNYNAACMASIIDAHTVSEAGPRADAAFAGEVGRMVRLGRAKRGMSRRQLAQESGTSERYLAQIESGAGKDRKSTRLNSSHRCISYAVFCLKKKKTRHRQTQFTANSDTA